MKGCVYLVGAGCGEADLITLRGLRLLRRCDVVVYDDLIDPELLLEVPEGAEQIYMGKRRGRHSAPQAEISQLLIEKAQAGHMVVRLKGGDPFVFGRGGEEMQALREAGIPCEEIPGISSAIAVPAAAGIPVTHRGVSRSLHIITGHTADGRFPEDFAHLAALRGTLVFLMGLAHLEAIADGLLRAGKAPDTPAAVISGVSAACTETVRAPLGSLAEQARRAHVQPPAVIVIGETAARDVSGTVAKPLRGIRVGVTGTEAVTAKMKENLRELGAEIQTVGVTRVEELPIPGDIAQICSGSHWLVFTSANGVQIFFKRLREQRIDVRRLSGCRFAVIGAATGQTLKEHGICPDLCPEVYTSAGLAEALLRQVGERESVWLFRSRQGTATLPGRLAAEGVRVHEVPLYTLRGVPARKAEDLDKLDYLAFFSASGVDFFYEAYGMVPEKTACICIGEVTAKALRRHGNSSCLLADTISVEGVVKAILEHRHCTAPQ